MGCWSATGRTLAAVFGGRAPEYYRGGETPGWAGGDAGHAGDDGHGDDHAGQLNFYKLSFEGTRRWRALKLWMTWKHLGTTGFGRLIERTTTSPRRSPDAARRRTTSRRCPPCPS